LSETFSQDNQAGLTKHINWEGQARESQRTPDGDWSIWLILAGRGWGKTRTGAEDLVCYALMHPESVCAVVAPTGGDLRRVCFEGVSGLLSCIPEHLYYKGNRTSFNRSTFEIRLANGSLIQGFAAIEPDRLRGSQFHRAWCDELAAWRYTDAFDQLMFGLRLGNDPRCIITTTPRPSPLIIDLVKRSGKDVILTRGSTFENEQNLAPSALQQLKERYEGTQLGRQELYAEVLDSLEGALWNHAMIDEQRINKEQLPELSRIVVSLDPAVTANANSDETGILVVGKCHNNRYYVLEDSSGKFSADAWARKAVDLYYLYQADRIVAETNNGGDLVERLIRGIDRQVSYKPVHATRGKMVRAEPISALYEQKKVSHVGVLSKLEDQMTSYTGIRSTSPDRLDALVWGLTELSKSSGQPSWRIS
tara:strand:- start:2442 stop:3704 length:1263 start_codon:yes stop_codon:yes gene_type:complete